MNHRRAAGVGCRLCCSGGTAAASRCVAVLPPFSMVVSRMCGDSQMHGSGRSSIFCGGAWCWESERFGAEYYVIENRGSCLDCTAWGQEKKIQEMLCSTYHVGCLYL